MTMLPWAAFMLMVGVYCQAWTAAGQDCVEQPDLVEAGRICRKSCETDENCKGKKKSCLCDGVCGKTCFNPEAICEAPEEILHGSINGNRTYNQTITYSCDEGYILIGSRTRRCRSDKKWSGSQPLCRRTNCSTPAAQRNGYANSFQDTYRVGEEVEYVCKLGYTISGTAVVKCKEDGNWTEAKFSCSRRRCPEPLIPDNANKQGNDYTFGNRVYYHCKPGYIMLERQNYRTCSAKGRWSGQLPTCEVVNCPAPVAPNQGSVDTSLTEYPYNTLVRYSCQQGFKIEGSAVGVCDESGTWGNVPRCVVDKDCNFEDGNHEFCGYKNIRSMWRRVSSSNVLNGARGFVVRPDFGSSLLPISSLAVLRSPAVRSDQGFCLMFHYFLRQLSSGQDFVVAVLDGDGSNRREIWKSDPRERKQSWLNADVLIETSSESSIVEFSVRKSLSMSPTSLDLDELSLSDPERCQNECTAVVCRNGGTCRNQINSFRCLCRSGYRGTKCETRISCPTLNIPHSTHQPVQRVYYVGSKISYSCNRGFTLSGWSELTCGRLGQWTQKGRVFTRQYHPSCSRVLCPAVKLGQFQSLWPQKSQWYVDDVVTFSCFGGTELIGKGRLVCGEAGQWSFPQPRCRGGTECVVRNNPTNSNARPSRSLWYSGDNVTYSCQAGYRLLGSAISRCQENGRWSRDLPVCAALPESRFHLTDVQLNFDQSRQRCRSLGGDLAIIHNAQEQDYLIDKAKRLYPRGETFYIGLVRVGRGWFSSGYFQWINGRSVSDGFQNWNTGEPNDGGNENCGIMYIADQTVWNDINCNREFFAVCETVYNPCINNPCLHNGICSKRENTFSCKCPVYTSGNRCENVIQCPAPVLHPSLNTVPSRNADSYRVGTRFTLTCDIGKVFVGNPKNIECHKNKRWSETSGVCKTFCKRPAILSPVQISTSSHHLEPFLVSHVVQFECTNPNQVPDGVQRVSCQGTGLWTDRAPTRCINRGQAPRQCPVIRSPSHGNIQQVGPVPLFRLQSIVKFTCNDGYKRIGPSRISCESNNVWSANAPTCKEVGCTLPSSPTFLRISFIPGVEYPVGHKLQAKCVSNLTHSITLTCLGGHRWNPRINRKLC